MPEDTLPIPVTPVTPVNPIVEATVKLRDHEGALYGLAAVEEDLQARRIYRAAANAVGRVRRRYEPKVLVVPVIPAEREEA